MKPLCIAFLWLVSVMARSLVDIDLFVGGEGGYACYRLPNLVQLQKPGHLLAVVQVIYIYTQYTGRDLRNLTQKSECTWCTPTTSSVIMTRFPCVQGHKFDCSDDGAMDIVARRSRFVSK